MDNITSEFFDFVSNVTDAYSGTKTIKEMLIDQGYQELFETDDWSKLDKNGKYMVVKGDSSLIAFRMPGKNKKVGFNIVASHIDSPSFIIKPNADMYDNKYLKLNLDKYGGAINYSWFDRPLSISGRVVTKTNGVYESKFVSVPKDILIIPSQALHINRDVNEKNTISIQNDMLPIMSLTDNEKLIDVIKKTLINNGESFDEIIDYDLFLYNRDYPRLVGLNDEFILSPRLDDLSCLYPSIASFISSSENETIPVLCSFNNEEIGSMTTVGADSTFLRDTLERIASACGMDLKTSLANSFFVSADNEHAIHPNAGNKSDPTNKLELNKGITIKYDINSLTDSLSSSLFRGICDNAGVPYQNFVNKADVRTGSTLGRIVETHASMDGIDIGLPQLAMHSANETMGRKDVLYLCKSLKEFYETKIVREKGNVRLLNK